MSRLIDNYKKMGQSKFSVAKAQARLLTLRDLWTRCQEVHIKIVKLVPDEQRSSTLYFVNEVFLDAEMLQEEVADFFHDHIDQISPAATSSPLLTTDSNATTIHMVQGDTTTTKRTTLPRIQLPQFTGRYEEWPAFRDLFESLICKESALGKVEKLHYLKTSLRGEPEALIKKSSYYWGEL